MSITEYLDSQPFFEVEKYHDHSALDAVAFIGTLRKHPYDSEKCLLLAAEQMNVKWLETGALLEFRIADVLAADELPSPVDESGTARALVKIWVRKGAIALRYEPFEVGDRPLGPKESPALKARYSRLFHDRIVRG